MGDLQELLSGLSPEPRARGRQFERVCKWLLMNAPMYRSFVRRVWLWDEWPGRWGIDAGIDLVAETRDRTLWAVQAIDVPTLDGIAFIDPRRSQVDVMQAVGRAIRRAPDKKIGTIVL